MCTPTRRRCLSEIRKFIQDHKGLSPSIADIADALGYAKQTVHYHLGQLEQAGYVTRIPGAARSLRLTDKAEELLSNGGVS